MPFSFYARCVCWLPLCLVAFALPNADVKAQDPLWDATNPVPAAADLPDVEGIKFHVIKARQPERDGFNWLHGVALAWHGEKLFASFGHNSGKENTASEIANYTVSEDGGQTWSKVKLIDDGKEEDLAVSHGVFLRQAKTLWAFQGAFYGRMKKIHTRAYSLDEASGQWRFHGVVIEDGFWPMQEPQKMPDGNWIMAGLQVVEGIGGGNNPAAVAISHGNDFTKWSLVSVPRPAAMAMWGESTVVANGRHVTNISRFRQPVALVSRSADYGRTWSTMKESNLPMTASKPYAGTLSTGQAYLIGNTTADSRNRRWPLTITVTDQAECSFRRVFKIRDAEHPHAGESHPKAALSYPYAIEHQGKLYVGYSNDGGRGANRNSAELAVIPVTSVAGR